MASVKQDKNLSQANAASVAIDLRLVLNDTRAMLDEFETYVESWEQQVDAQKADPVTHDPRSLTEQYVIIRALEQLDEIAHMPTGGTRHLHFRNARTRLIMLAQSAPQD